jgi:hypothetical protein
VLRLPVGCRRPTQPPAPAKASLREVGGWCALLGLSLPAPFSGQAAAKKPAAGRALSRPNSGVSFGLDRRSPPGRYTVILPGRAGVLVCREPLGADGRAGAARSQRRREPQREHGDGAGWVGAKAAMDAARRPRKPAGLEPEVRLT